MSKFRPAPVDAPGVYVYIDPQSGGARFAFIAQPPVRAAYARAIVTAPTRHVRIQLSDIAGNAYPDATPTTAARRWLRGTKFLRQHYAAGETPAVRRTLRHIRELARGEVAA